MLYAVYLQDTNGHRRLVGNHVDIEEAEARKVIAEIEASHTKPHKVDYDLVGYTRETKAMILEATQIEGWYHHA